MIRQFNNLVIALEINPISESLTCIANQCQNVKHFKDLISTNTPNLDFVFLSVVANDVNNVANNIKTDFIDHLEIFTHTGRGRLAVSDNIGLDLVFAYDISTSLNHVNFERGINFTESLLRRFGVSYDKGKCSGLIISHISSAWVRICFNSSFQYYKLLECHMPKQSNRLFGMHAFRTY